MKSLLLRAKFLRLRIFDDFKDWLALIDNISFEIKLIFHIITVFKFDKLVKIFSYPFFISSISFPFPPFSLPDHCLSLLSPFHIISFLSLLSLRTFPSPPFPLQDSFFSLLSPFQFIGLSSFLRSEFIPKVENSMISVWEFYYSESTHSISKIS